MADQQNPSEPVPPQEMPVSSEDLAGPAASSANEPVGGRDVAMADGMADAPSPAPALAPAQPNHAGGVGRTGTPVRHTAANSERLESSSRAASVHPESTFTIPSEAPAHGAPVRQYINSKVTGPLLDGMKLIAKEQPRDPLRVLGEYLLQRSRELEGTS